ncbi:hypothetical protein FNU76_17350 [Chitinimonas arctica]|uniref:Lipoprotein n=1 Tax=Chitinimonas arctica TaxID=2594795 RepID=A0A516SIJ1_9NEIS|nr:hypothetical protein [Chitinimonas arctica]QDQ27967.1 hypothetical protein FNU76_17350 [Chitinimonas arctica]
MNRFSVFLIAGTVAGLSACAGMTVNNTSLLDGSRQFGKTELHTYPVRILAIDREYTIDVNPVRVEPGEHSLRVAAAPVAGFSQPVTKDVPFTVQACKRYYLAAKRTSPLRQDFELIVQQVEDRTDCHKG